MRRLSRRALLMGGAAAGAALGAPARKGARINSPAEEIEDPLTGRPLFRLTDPAVAHNTPHYHHRFLSRDNSFLLMAADHSGSRQIYRYEFRRERMVQLTEGSDVLPYSPTLDGRGRNMFYMQGDWLLQASARSGRATKLYQAPPDWRFTGHLSVTEDGRRAAFIEMRASDVVDGFEAQYERKPLCRLRVIELENKKEARTVVEEEAWLAYPQFRPGRIDLLYAHEGPWHRVDGRIRTVSFDGSGQRNLLPREGVEGRGHEYWTFDGSQIRCVYYPDEKGRGATVRAINPETGEEGVLARCSAYGWLKDNGDGTAIIGASRSLSGPNVFALFVKIGRELTLCEHGSSFKECPLPGGGVDRLCAAPEPFFSSDSQWIYFSSDRDGETAIYRMKVEDLAAET